MKTNLKHFAIVCCLFGTIFQLHSQGYIVPNGVSLYPGNATGHGSTITVIQNPANEDYTGFSLDPQGADTFLFYLFLDEGVRTFLVSLNDPISLQAILSQNYTELGFQPNYVFDEGDPFYLGFYTGYNPWDSHGNYTGIYTDPVFGWGEFVNDGGVIEMLDSGLEIQGGGIFAGTDNIIPIPEPSTLGLSALGAAVFGFYWRRKSSQV